MGSCNCMKVLLLEHRCSQFRREVKWSNITVSAKLFQYIVHAYQIYYVWKVYLYKNIFTFQHSRLYKLRCLDFSLTFSDHKALSKRIVNLTMIFFLGNMHFIHSALYLIASV